jgi:hypothetical protein
MRYLTLLLVIGCSVAFLTCTGKADWEPSHDTVAGMLLNCKKNGSCNSRIRDFLTGWIVSGGAKPADANMEFSVHRTGLDLPVFCIPQETLTEMGMSHIRTLFTKWADEHPYELHQTWDAGLVNALKATFPCRP